MSRRTIYPLLGGVVVVDDDDGLPLSGMVVEELEVVELDIEPPRVAQVPQADAEPRTP